MGTKDAVLKVLEDLVNSKVIRDYGVIEDPDEVSLVTYDEFMLLKYKGQGGVIVNLATNLLWDGKFQFRVKAGNNLRLIKNMGLLNETELEMLTSLSNQ